MVAFTLILSFTREWKEAFLEVIQSLPTLLSDAG
jgi:hypothetical protein